MVCGKTSATQVLSDTRLLSLNPDIHLFGGAP